MSETDDYMMLPIGWEPFVVRERHDLLSEMMRRIQPLSPPPYDEAGEGRSVPSLIERFRGLGQGDVVEAVSNGTIPNSVISARSGFMANNTIVTKIIVSPWTAN